MTDLERFLQFLAADNSPDRKIYKFRARLHDTLLDFLEEEKAPRRSSNGSICDSVKHIGQGGYCPDCQP